MMCVLVGFAAGAVGLVVALLGVILTAGVYEARTTRPDAGCNKLGTG